MEHWIEKAVVYHIYPLGFCGCEKLCSSVTKIHNRLEKVLEWMGHLKSLNVNTVYFGPVFESVQHGYDTTDYKLIDRRLGTNDDFKRVCDVLHENGFRIVLDGVFNHVGRDFFAFRDVQQNKQNSKYADWFVNVDFNSDSCYNDGFSYEGWSGCYNLVKLNLYNQNVIDYLISAIKLWIDEWNIDGIRFDVGDCLTHEFIRQVHTFTKNIKPDFWLMGEVIHGNYAVWANKDMFDSVTNYQCYKGIYSSHNDRNYFEIAHSIEQQHNQYKDLYLYNFVDNHDVTRLASILKNKEHIYCCYTLLFMMYGVPSIYYGSEFGITGEKGSGDNADDMIRPCLELNNIHNRNEKLLRHISVLGSIRQNTKAVQSGTFEKIELKNQTFLFKRAYNGEVVYVALNISDGDYTFNFKSEYLKLADRLSGKRFDTDNYNASITVGSNCSVILVSDEMKQMAVCSETHTDNKPEESEKAVQQPCIIQQKEQPSEERKVIIGGHYKHFKGGDYVVLNIAKDSETLEDKVVYMAIYDKPVVWVRPLKMFLDNVDVNGKNVQRFTLVND